MSKLNSKSIYALRVNQWLKTWDSINFNKKERRTKPEPFFYTFSMSAKTLKDLSGIQRREKRHVGGKDLGIQRRHDSKRSQEISEYIQYGYPWSSLNAAQKKSENNVDLFKPGWLPTAIIVNILTSKDERYGVKVNSKDLVQVKNLGDKNLAEIILPINAKQKSGSEGLRPIQVIDGQHRLYAFLDDIDDDYELPVVAFHGLDVSWEAYIFWAVNIKPKRINASLAFDLYPLLRSEDWVNKEEDHKIYRETRSQELVEALWSNEHSPWYRRINMLGDTGGQRMVSQSAWVNSLMNTFVKSSITTAKSIAGIYGSKIGKANEVLRWSGAQQVAYLIYFGNKLQNAVKKTEASWATDLRTEGKQKGLFDTDYDEAFYGTNSLLNTDQGIRGLLQIFNDFSVLHSDELGLSDWSVSSESGALNSVFVKNAIKSLEKNVRVRKFVGDLANTLAEYDWRTSKADSLQTKENEQIRRLKLAFRGSSGYRELKSQLVQHCESSGIQSVSKVAGDINKRLKLYK